MTFVLSIQVDQVDSEFRFQILHCKNDKKMLILCHSRCNMDHISIPLQYHRVQVLQFLKILLIQVMEFP